jgi:parallel beta-helix repeat protein
MRNRERLPRPDHPSSIRVVLAAFVLGLVACGLAILGDAGTQPALAVPPNDTFANAITVTAPYYSGFVISGTNVGATIGNGPDPLPSCTGNLGRSTTVWYKWHAPSTNMMSFDTIGSDFDTTLAIYTGPSLTEVACSNDFGGTTRSAVRALFQKDADYYIQIGGVLNANGTIVLSSARGRDMVVTLEDDTNINDTYLTLREALLISHRSGYGDLGRPPSAAEAALVLGIGETSPHPADIIHFAPDYFQSNSPRSIFLNSALPGITDYGNTLSGLGAGVIVDGQSLNFTCLDIANAQFANNDNTVEGLQFRHCSGAGFPAALRTSGSYTTIGGSSIPAQRNVFSQNSVAVAVIAPGMYSRVIGNYIGTNAAGTAVSSNALGIAVTGAYNQIGGSAPGEGNLLGSSTYEQIVIRNATATGNTVRGNRVGGVPGSGASWGIRIDTQAQGNVIGGPFPGDGNVVTGMIIGVLIESGPNVVAGNKIGTDATGSTAMGNSYGLKIGGPATGVTIGGTTPGEANVISGNVYQGVIIQNTSGNLVQGNYIGTNPTGSGPVPNALGLGLHDAAGNTIGGMMPGAGNIISGNTADGVLIDNTNGNNASPNVLYGNTIGSHAGGGVPMPNTGAGVHIRNSAGNQVGSTALGGSNIIAFNNGGGVRVDNGSPASNGNSIRGNSIHDNVGMGIDLTGGANDGTAPPVIMATGPASGTACANCTVDVYSDSDAEGRIYKGTAIADGSGTWSYAGGVTGPNVTAIATNSSGSSSEFSAPFPLPVICTDADSDGFCNEQDNCPAWPNAAQNLPNWPVPAEDPDCDGWNDTREAWMGTDPLDHCNDTTATIDEPLDAWPTDLNDSRMTNLSDVVLIGPVYNQPTGTDPARKRFDMNASGAVNLSDVVMMGPFYNKGCG